MKANFFTKEDFDLNKLKCNLCGAEIEEGYMLYPSIKEWDRIIKLFQTEETSDWCVGECCVGGFCHRFCKI